MEWNSSFCFISLLSFFFFRKNISNIEQYAALACKKDSTNIQKNAAAFTAIYTERKEKSHEHSLTASHLGWQHWQGVKEYDRNTNSIHWSWQSIREIKGNCTTLCEPLSFFDGGRFKFLFLFLSESDDSRVDSKSCFLDKHDAFLENYGMIDLYAVADTVEV